jgi:hypothetical protein
MIQRDFDFDFGALYTSAMLDIQVTNDFRYVYGAVLSIRPLFCSS